MDNNKDLIKWISKIEVRLRIWLINKAYSGLGTAVCRIENGVHPKHRLMNYHKFFLDNIQETDRVIDVGCGKGIVTMSLAKKASHVTGIDIDHKNIENAVKLQNKQKLNNISFIEGDALKMGDDKHYDKIVLSNVLEHITERITFLKRLSLIGDVLLLRVPMVDRDWLTLYKRELGLYYKLDKTHQIEYTEEVLKDELQEGNWKIKQSIVKFGETWAVCKSID